MNLNPKYSILLCNQHLDQYKNSIAHWLHIGIKVIWFGSDEDVSVLRAEHGFFAEAFLLLAYPIHSCEEVIIVDGNDPERFVERVLQEKCPLFNSAQYMVEHCNSTRHVIVQASAGTGKTTVMIDRILYLLHTQPDLHLSEVFMITV